MKLKTPEEVRYDVAADYLSQALYFVSDRLAAASADDKRLRSYLSDAKRSLNQARVFLREAQAEETRLMNLIDELKATSAFEYKRIETDSVANIARAEKLVAAGWKIVSSSFFSVLLERKKA